MSVSDVIDVLDHFLAILLYSQPIEKWAFKGVSIELAIGL